MGTYRLPCDELSMSAPNLGKYLGMELEKKPLVEVHDLIDRLYPDNVLPFAITPDILSDEKMDHLWDKSKKIWKFEEVYDEEGFGDILNNIAVALGKIFNQKQLHVWTARVRHCSPGFSGRFKN